MAKQWSPRKVLIVAAAGKVDKEKIKLLEAVRVKDRAYEINLHVWNCIEGVIADWKQKQINPASLRYWQNLKPRYHSRLIRDVRKEARL